MTSALRRGLVRRLVADEQIASQAELVAMLSEHGYRVTQATVSRDLAAVGARKVTGPGGDVYALAGSEDDDADLAAAIGSFVEEVAESANLVVLRTPPGAAHLVAAAIDRARPAGVIGTVAGDDTLLVVADAAVGGGEIAERIRTIGGVT